MFSDETSDQLDRLVLLYNSLCLDYISQIGKLGSNYNGVTNKWLGSSSVAKQMKKLLKDITADYSMKTREEKYWLLREVYAFKPGVHEQFYREKHDGTVLGWLQERFGGGMSLASAATYYLKSLLTIENFYGLDPFLEVDAERAFPSTPLGAQAETKRLMEETDWRALDGLIPLGSWLNYSPCAINEGPFFNRKGMIICQNLGNLAMEVGGYRETIEKSGITGVEIPDFIG